MWKFFLLYSSENGFMLCYASHGLRLTKKVGGVVAKRKAKFLQIKQHHIVNNYYTHFVSLLEVSWKVDFTKQVKWDQSITKTTHRLDRFAVQLMVQSTQQEKTQKWLLPCLTKSLCFWGVRMPQHKEKSTSKSRRHHKRKERKGIKMFPVITYRATSLSTALHWNLLCNSRICWNKHSQSAWWQWKSYKSLIWNSHWTVDPTLL